MKKDILINAYTGTQMTVMLLKSELEKAGVVSVIQNDFQSGINAGFSGGVPSAIDFLSLNQTVFCQNRSLNSLS